MRAVMSNFDSENKKGKKCRYYDKCPLRMHPLSAMDNPNSAAHLGFRFFLYGSDMVYFRLQSK